MKNKTQLFSYRFRETAFVGTTTNGEAKEQEDLLLLLMCFFTYPSTSYVGMFIHNHLTLGIVLES